MSAASRGSRARARQNNAAAAKAAEASRSDQTDTPPTESMDVDLPDPSMQLLAEAAQNQARAPELDEIKDEEEDSRSSSLSDIDDRGGTEGSEQPENESAASEDDEPEEDDTEAETERIEPTPDKTRKQRKVLLNSILEDNASSVAAQDELDPDQAEEELEEKAEDDGAEQAEGAEESGGSSAEESEQEPAETRGKKRKRADDDETAKALKRVSLGLANHAAEQLKEPDDDDTPEPIAPDAALEDDDVSGDESQGEEPAEATTTADAEEPAESNLEDADVDDATQEADASTNARTEEDLKNKKAALEKLSDIEKDFALLRDKLFADRNAQLAEELATIQSDTPTHPEYLAMVEAIEQLRNERIEHAKTVYRFKLQALQKKATTTRAAAQSQYMQRIRELRDDFLERASAEWYQIQRERRNFDADKEPALNHFSGERSQWIASQTAYNTEVSVLSGVAKYVGFPAAPEIRGATAAEVEEDLKRMGISRNPAPTPAAAPISQLGRPKPAAEEQFIAETAWANPQHQQSQYLTNVHRQISNNLRPGSPVNTPAAQKQTADPATNGSASTIPALPSSSLAPTPMSADVHAAGVLVSKSTPGAGTLDTPSKPPDKVEPKPLSGLAGPSQDSSQATQALVNENGTDATTEGAGAKPPSTPPAQPAPALKESMSGQLEGQSSLPPGVQVGSG